MNSISGYYIIVRRYKIINISGMIKQGGISKFYFKKSKNEFKYFQLNLKYIILWACCCLSEFNFVK